MTMINKRAADRGTRSPVTPLEVKGRINIKGGGSADPVLIWNISDEGLCLWVTARLPAKAKVSIAIVKPFEAELGGEVRWCRTIPERSGFLVGLKIDENAEQLALIHQFLTQNQHRAG